MRYVVKMPKLGDASSNAVIDSWKAAVGDSVVAGDPLLSAETSKALVDVPAPVTGVLVELLCHDDDEVDVGSPIAVIEG